MATIYCTAFSAVTIMQPTKKWQPLYQQSLWNFGRDFHPNQEQKKTTIYWTLVESLLVDQLSSNQRCLSWGQYWGENASSVFKLWQHLAGHHDDGIRLKSLRTLFSLIWSLRAMFFLQIALVTYVWNSPLGFPSAICVAASLKQTVREGTAKKKKKQKKNSFLSQHFDSCSKYKTNVNAPMYYA